MPAPTATEALAGLMDKKKARNAMAGIHQGTFNIVLRACTARRIENAVGLAVTCLRGVARISREDDQQPVTLRAGEWLFFDRPGPTMVTAFTDTEILLGTLPQARADVGASAAPSCSANVRCSHLLHDSQVPSLRG